MSSQKTHKTDTSQDRPLVTFALFAYNQEQYIREAVSGALAQTYSPLEILLSDDCSSDSTFEIMREMVRSYAGPHVVRLNRNESNLGLIGHVNEVCEMACGDLIVVAAGDDISFAERVDCLMTAYKKQGFRPTLIHSTSLAINASNDPIGVLVPPLIERTMSLADIADSGSLYIGATGAWSRSLYHEFGPIVFSDAYEDLVYGFRAALKNSLVYVDKPLVRYRVGVGLSSTQTRPKFAIRSRVRARKKILKVNLDVYCQRLIDLGRAENPSRTNGLLIRLTKNITLTKQRLNFYSSPATLLTQLFSKNFILAIKAFKSEIRYLLG